ncbi:MAG: hypothetical protein ACE5EN_11025, partial [Nitrospinota bacterium]
MAHKVNFCIPERELGKADIEFKVKKNSKTFGRLTISKGAVEWYPKGVSKRGRKMGWTLFDNVMQEKGVRK